MGRKLVGATGNAGLVPRLLTTSFPPIHLVYGFSSIPAPTDLSDLSDLSDKKAGADPLKWEKNRFFCPMVASVTKVNEINLVPSVAYELFRLGAWTVRPVAFPHGNHRPPCSTGQWRPMIPIQLNKFFFYRCRQMYVNVLFS
jgi:hypothetical protein